MSDNDSVRFVQMMDKPKPGRRSSHQVTTRPVPAAPAARPQMAQRAQSMQSPQPKEPIQQSVPAFQEQIVEQTQTNVSSQLKGPSAKPYVPEPIVAEKRIVDSTFEDVFPPSAFVAYEFQQLAARRMRVEDMRAIVRSRATGSLRHLVRAIDNTLSQSVYDLTLGDFWWMMYWHRLNSYKKTPFVINWTCQDPKHLAKIESKEMEPKSLKNLTTISASQLKVVEIDPQKYLAVAERIWNEYGLTLQPLKMADFLAMHEEEERLELTRKKQNDEQAEQETDEVAVFMSAMENVAEDEDRSFINRYASMIHPQHGKTLEERVNVINQLPPDALDDFEEMLMLCEHGVEEKFVVKCDGCGASRTIEQSLDALHFLPSVFGRGHS